MNEFPKPFMRWLMHTHPTLTREQAFDLTMIRLLFGFWPYQEKLSRLLNAQ